MINPQELRIGNFILFNGEPTMVKGILADAVMLDGTMPLEGDGTYEEHITIPANNDSLKPLPLSGTLLEALRKGRWEDDFGIQYQYHSRSGHYTIRKDEDGYYIGMYKSDGPVHITPGHILYLHQLQNIHFAQYGYEMDVHEHDVIIAWRTVQMFKH